MATYDFDLQLDRRGTNCYKYDGLNEEFGNENLIPLWVADMDFATPPFIIEALQERLLHPVLGYPRRPDDYWQMVSKWVEDHHGWHTHTSWYTYIPGIVKGIGMVTNVFTRPGDKIIIQPPVYHPFRLVPEGNGREVVFNPLKETPTSYEMDFDHLASICDESCRLLILCNPHNPVGITWPRETLQRLAHFAVEHNLIVVSDEIHCDMALFGHRHTPFASVSDEAASCSITFQAPSKTFNIAGVVTSFCIIPDQTLRHTFLRWMEANEFDYAPLFSTIATRAAYTQGEEWRQQMLHYVEDNILWVEDYLQQHIPEIRAIRPQASFLVWLDCREMGLSQEALNELFLQRAHLALNDGAMFGPGGEGHMRLNVGCPRKTLEQAFAQLKAAIKG